MARKPALSVEALVALGPEKLAQIILDEAADSAPFRKRVNAALASLKGPDAVAKLVDRRLGALERAQSLIPWEKEKAFAADLQATVDTIVKELAAADAFAAVNRLLRFLGTQQDVLERTVDSGGRLSNLYWEAAESAHEMLERLKPVERAQVAQWLTGALESDDYSLFLRVALVLVPLLSDAQGRDWESALAKVGGDLAAPLEVRQALAEARGDMDTVMALEARLPSWRQNPMRLAERLLAAGRYEDALRWVRTEDKPNRLIVATTAELLSGTLQRRWSNPDKIQLEAKILEAMKDRAAAQSLRWKGFEATLNATLLRDYIAKLDDFQEFDELDRAFALVAASKDPHTALDFFIRWPRLDLAASLVFARRGEWRGAYYDVLSDAAMALEEKFPLAATVLYRVLLDDILGRGVSAAYGHGARYLARLGALAPRIEAYSGMDNHTTYALRLRKDHGRKSSFWSQVTPD
ncbi:DUF6880 family protein [Nitrospirillum sp. BR 11828]|uniref:DUF6880 family protein n=1 Tax=Nitrospirillum sp. BR 11828 TaxID=3104325 RepID=UPI002ACAF59E|nr:DUF6880 family protein [Nitrospirillum sp. BR 11828]MDZ5646488.1 hypothetical protein [Nitrospirillum sp. BR 11828]